MAWAILLLRPYLEGARLKARADPDGQRKIISLADTSRKLARWGLFEFDVVSLVHAKNQATDPLLRLPADREDKPI